MYISFIVFQSCILGFLNSKKKNILRLEKIQGSTGEENKEEEVENKFLLLNILNFRLGFQVRQAASDFLCSSHRKYKHKNATTCLCYTSSYCTDSVFTNYFIIVQ